MSKKPNLSPVQRATLSPEEYSKTLPFFEMMQPLMVGQMSFAQAVIRDVSEMEPYDQSADDALVVSVNDLEWFIEQRLMDLAKIPVPHVEGQPAPDGSHDTTQPN